MAISKELWGKAKGYYEAGLTLSQIKDKTGIDRSTISKKAKNQQWQHQRNGDYIKAREIIAEKKSTENQQSILCADEVADESIRRKKLVYGIGDKLAEKLNDSLDGTTTIINDKPVDLELNPQELKFIADSLDRLSLTLGVNQRHANTNIAVQQNNENKLPTTINIVRDD